MCRKYIININLNVSVSYIYIQYDNRICYNLYNACANVVSSPIVNFIYKIY